MIYKSLGSNPYESGGLIGSSNGETIDVFYYDKGRRSNTNEYYPDIDALQQRLFIWDNSNIMFSGIIHSHTISDRLSPKDIQMARSILNINKIASICMPIYLISEHKIFWYEVSNDDVVFIDSPTIIH